MTKITAEDLPNMTGQEIMQAVADGHLPRAPIARILDFDLTEVKEGFCQFTGRLSEDFHNPMGGIHGGYTATILDSAMSCAVMAALPKGVTYTTLEIKVNYIRAFTGQDGLVRAIGQTIHVGRRTATAEGKLLNEAGKILAHGTTTCMVFPPN
jgi:uncharacterized protein (TIGR00369 family)